MKYIYCLFFSVACICYIYVFIVGKAYKSEIFS